MDERMITMKQNKIISAIMLVLMLGLFSLNIPMIALAYFGDKAEKRLMQDLNVAKIANEEPVAVDNAPDEKTALAVGPGKTVSKPKASSYNKSAAPSRSSVNRSNLDSLARLVYGEARGESFVGQVAVAAVVLNRVESKKFGNTVTAVIFEPGAFTAVSDGQYYLNPDDSAYRAAQAALDGWDPTENAIYYWNPVTATNKWVWSRPITITIGKHVFAH